MGVSRNLVGIGIYFCNTEEEELFVSNPSKVGTEEFDFGIERFCKRIGRTVIVESTDRKATERKLHETQVEKL